MLRQESMAVVPPPNTHTVKKTMSRVVLNIICRAYVAVSRMASAKAMAPRSPEGRDSRAAVSAPSTGHPRDQLPTRGLHPAAPLLAHPPPGKNSDDSVTPPFRAQQGKPSSCPVPCTQSRTGGAHSYILNH